VIVISSKLKVKYLSDIEATVSNFSVPIYKAKFSNDVCSSIVQISFKVIEETFISSLSEEEFSANLNFKISAPFSQSLTLAGVPSVTILTIHASTEATFIVLVVIGKSPLTSSAVEPTASTSLICIANSSQAAANHHIVATIFTVSVQPALITNAGERTKVASSVDALKVLAFVILPLSENKAIFVTESSQPIPVLLTINELIVISSSPASKSNEAIFTPAANAGIVAESAVFHNETSKFQAFSISSSSSTSLHSAIQSS
jgi:hypothetical protein